MLAVTEIILLICVIILALFLSFLSIKYMFPGVLRKGGATTVKVNLPDGSSENVPLYGNPSGQDLRTNVGSDGTYSYNGAVIRPSDILLDMGISNGSVIDVDSGNVENITLTMYAMRHHQGLHFIRNEIHPTDIDFVAVDGHGNRIGLICVNGPDVPKLRMEIDDDKDRVTIYHNHGLRYTIVCTTNEPDLLGSKRPEKVTDVFDSTMPDRYTKKDDHTYIFNQTN